MRNTLPLLGRAQPPPPPADTTPSQHPLPTIRLISATPSAAGSASDASTSFSAVAPFSAASPLAPKADVQPRKKLVPKKSKLGLLGAAVKAKDKGTSDFSDIARRVGENASTGRSGFEIYVDRDEDPEFGEIVVVKKKKSRGGLNGMAWGTLGEVTNVPSAPKQPKQAQAHAENLLKVKPEGSQKWWSIGRGRKESVKAKAKDENAPPRSKTPEPAKVLDSRARFNSLDSGVVLSGFPSLERLRRPSKASVPPLSPSPLTPADDPPTNKSNGLLVPDASGATGSIAVRAIKSVRSLARMASWAQLTNATNGDNYTNEPAGAPAPVKTKTKEGKKEKGEKGEVKKKKKKENTIKEKTLRSSGSSFEAGALSAPGSPPVANTEGLQKTLQHRKQSMLGLGLPSSLRINTVRQVSAASSAELPTPANRLSADSANLVERRPSSVLSSGSSLRPPSTASGVSAFSTRSQKSSTSSVVSVRWDEERIRSSKEMTRQERRSRRHREGQTSRQTSDAQKRTPISEIFPQIQMQPQPEEVSPPPSPPMVRVEEATADGHSDGNVSIAETPAKHSRPRPMSEQLLGKSIPQPLIAEEGEGVISILDAVTNDLASLITRLDLEATPGSATNSPLQLFPAGVQPVRPNEDSPVKKRTIRRDDIKTELRESAASISSLRPYACSQEAPKQSLAAAQLIGKQITPWSELQWEVSPRKGPTSTVATVRPRHKRTFTPLEAPEPPVFLPLKPASAKPAATLVTSSSPEAKTPLFGTAPSGQPSSATFGSRPSKLRLKTSADLDGDDPSASPTPVFKRAAKKASLTAPLRIKKSQGSIFGTVVPISEEARKGLGLAGTMGGSGSTEPIADLEDPDSDIPDELQVILSGQSDEEGERCLDDTLSFPRRSPLPLSPMPLIEIADAPLEDKQRASPTPTVPVFRAQLFDEDANQADIDDGGATSPTEDDTGKSFDFTGELRKLNESGASDRRSFVEQLESAFRTPARIDLAYGLGEHLGLNGDFLAAPPVPALPAALRSAPSEDVAPRSVSPGEFEISMAGSIIQAYRDSTMTEEYTMDDSVQDQCQILPELRTSRSVDSKASDGRLNASFKFGGKPYIPEEVEEHSERPLTLSDIIPPPELVRHLSRSSLLEEDDSVLKSIMAKASEIPPAQRMRLDSDSSSKRQVRDASASLYEMDSRSGHSRHTSEASFTGFDSFDEIRRGFEFSSNRAPFYPPPGAVSRPSHKHHESLFSIASVSSYGAVVKDGEHDPFGYALSRPPSDFSLSMSMSVDDTFSFYHRARGRRSRVDSDASNVSSFYFTAPSQVNSRGHRRHESTVSIISNGPPVSLYNRSFAGHRRNDSNTSASSVAQSYAMHGAYGGRAAWARHHRQDASVDSQLSDFSSYARVDRPGLGDKMFDHNYSGMPLSAITASPESGGEESRGSRLSRSASWDSLRPGERRSSLGESLFDTQDDITTMSKDSVFGNGGRYAYGRDMPVRQFRPISILSEASSDSLHKEDDTMITMLGGDRVRRRSLSSMIEASPCAKVDRRKFVLPPVPPPPLPVFKPMEPEASDSPKSRLVEKPSIASTVASHQFGGERMIKARRGILERQSLEDSALVAQGEEILQSLRSPVIFSRPGPANRSRSSTVTVASSGTETPPLSVSDGSSQSSGSQSSIDLNQLNNLLSNATYPSSIVARARTARQRARGTGHRRRVSQARASRSSVYETILEEASAASPGLSSIASMSPGQENNTVYIVEDNSESLHAVHEWNDERGIITMRKYCALRDEAEEAVTESKRVWADTPFSLFAVQSFHPPKHRGGMQALLEHSLKNYGPLPSELRPHRVRSRTSSRASPYPRPRSSASLSASPELSWRSTVDMQLELDLQNSKDLAAQLQLRPALREVPLSSNVAASPPPSVGLPNAFTPFAVQFSKDRSLVMEKEKAPPMPPLPAALPPQAQRQRVTSSARRTALGWSKRNAPKSSFGDNKENLSSSMIITPSETLRINRPRPQARGKPMSARVPVPKA